MATVLAYTSPAMGHMLPMSALLAELSSRGHDVHLRTLSSCVPMGRGFGFATSAIDPRIEAIELDDWKAPNPRAALALGIGAFGRRAEFEAPDLADAMARVRPDAVLVDVNCWGAMTLLAAGATLWACFSPYTPPLTAPGLPPFGLGLAPWPGWAGRVRDAALRATVVRSLERVMLPPVNAVRSRAGLAPVTSTDAFLRAAPLILVASGTPFQYPGTEWGENVELIGPCVIEPARQAAPDWLAAIDRPLVVVTTSSEKQADAVLVRTAIAALAGEPVHLVATMPTGVIDDDHCSAVTVRRFVPHAMVLERAVCAITHGGMGATQKALSHAVPVCVVPFGRDQYEVARRVVVAHCGTRVPARRLSAGRLRAAVARARTMSEGARAVAAGFAATGGVARGATLFEQRLLA